MPPSCCPRWLGQLECLASQPSPVKSLQPSWGLCLAVLTTCLLAAYALTMAPNFTFEDTALFTAACATLGVPHPPGYPLWVWTCAPFAVLAQAGGFSLGQGASFASAAAAAATCACLARLLERQIRNAPVALGTAAACGVSLTFWSQAIIPETYALNILLHVACLTLADSYVRAGGARKLPVLSLLGGLGLANHWPLFVIAGPAVALWLLPAWSRLREDLAQSRVWLGCLAGLVVGLLPYLHLWLASPTSARFLGADPAEGLLSYVGRGHFAALDAASQHPRWDERLRNGGWASVQVLGEYSWAGGVLGLFGLWVGWPKLLPWHRAALAWALLGTTAALAIYRPYLPQSELSASIFRNYGLPAYVVFALPLAFALAWVCQRCKLSVPAQWLAAAVLPLGLLAWHGPQVDRSADDLAVRHALLTNASLPAGTKILLGTGNADFPLGYFEHLSLASEVNFLPQTVASYQGPERGLAALPGLLAAEANTVALSSQVPARLAGTVWHGTHATHTPGGTAGLRLAPAARNLLRHAALLREQGNNEWTRDFADQLLFEFARRMHVARSTAEKPVAADVALLAELGETSGVRFANFLAVAATATSPEQLMQYVAGLGVLDQYPLQWRVDVKHIRAAMLLRSGAVHKAVRVLEQALQEFPAATNSRVLLDLLALHAQSGNFARYAHLRRRYPTVLATGLAGFDAQCAANLKRRCVP